MAQVPRVLSGTFADNVRLGHERRFDEPVSAARLGSDVRDAGGKDALVGHRGVRLSGGQVQLVALARAVAVELDVLLLDEPTAHLDPAYVALVEGVLTGQDRERPPTLIWATHNLFQARRVANRIALLLDGRLVEVADTEAFFTKPTDARTADFVQGKVVY